MGKYEIKALNQQHYEILLNILETAGFKIGSCMRGNKYFYLAINVERMTVNGNTIISLTILHLR